MVMIRSHMILHAFACGLFLICLLIPDYASGGGDVMELPTGQHVFPPYTPVSSPTVNAVALQARPIGAGPLASGEGTLSLRIGLPGFADPVDVYFGIEVPVSGPDNFFLLTPMNALQPVSAGVVAWKKDRSSVTDEGLFGDIPVALLPSGRYNLYLLVTPAGRLDNYYLWQTGIESWWRPVPRTSWQIQLEGTIDADFETAVYDIDLFDPDAAAVASLRAEGRRVICYFSAGSYEDWRPDAADFPAAILGNDYPDWPGERFLDIRSAEAREIMSRRLDLCKTKGFDGTDPDNIDVFDTDSGFPLTRQDGIDYARWLAREAHKRGLAIGQKNAYRLTEELQPYFDWALTEDCYGEDPSSPWCSQVAPYVANNKAVFMVEYTDAITAEDFMDNACIWGNEQNGFSPVLKNRDLDAALQTCR